MKIPSEIQTCCFSYSDISFIYFPFSKWILLDKTQCLFKAFRAKRKTHVKAQFLFWKWPWVGYFIVLLHFLSAIRHTQYIFHRWLVCNERQESELFSWVFLITKTIAKKVKNSAVVSLANMSISLPSASAHKLTGASIL
jgi:hypothetical protein